MRSPCANPHCTYAETGTCARRAEFPEPERQCPDLLRGRSNAGLPMEPPPSSPSTEDQTAAVPLLPTPSRFWSGLAMGSHEAADLLLNARTKLITIAGDKDSGKTCFLTALYIQLANGFTHGFPYRFAGSHTLRGFQDLCDQAFQWQGDNTRILPRTTQDNHRQPSFLHLALRRKDQYHTLPWHMLLTDMPGEWFNNWVDTGSDALPNTLEFLPRSDGFLVTVDAKRLLQGRSYRENQRNLLARIAALLKASPRPARPVALVLTKVDCWSKEALSSLPPPDQRLDAQAWGTLEKHIRPLLGELQELPPQHPRAVFPCASFSKPSRRPIGVFAPLAFLLQHVTAHRPLPPIELPRPSSLKAPKPRFFTLFREEARHD